MLTPYPLQRLENSFHTAIAMQDGYDIQRLQVGPVNNPVRVDGGYITGPSSLESGPPPVASINTAGGT